LREPGRERRSGHLEPAVAAALLRLPGPDLFDDLIGVLNIELVPTRSQLSKQIDQSTPLRL
jgi:hypothetical protein